MMRTAVVISYDSVDFVSLSSGRFLRRTHFSGKKFLKRSGAVFGGMFCFLGFCQIGCP